MHLFSSQLFLSLLFQLVVADSLDSSGATSTSEVISTSTNEVISTSITEVISPTSAIPTTDPPFPTTTTFDSSTITSSGSACSASASTSTFDITISACQSYPTAAPTTGDQQAVLLYEIGQSPCKPDYNNTAGFEDCVSSYYNSINSKRDVSMEMSDLQERGGTGDLDIGCKWVCCIFGWQYLSCHIKLKVHVCF